MRRLASVGVFVVGGDLLKLIHVLAFIPFLGVLGGIFFANRVEPYVIGLPFILFWIVAWVVLTSVLMTVIYMLDPANKEESR